MSAISCDGTRVETHVLLEPLVAHRKEQLLTSALWTLLVVVAMVLPIILGG